VEEESSLTKKQGKKWRNRRVKVKEQEAREKETEAERGGNKEDGKRE
jgi:hypothetical protein